MTDSAVLLRMLEPAVRPVTTPAGGAGAAQLPLEQRDFESLLNELRTTEQAEAGEQTSQTKLDPLRAL